MAISGRSTSRRAKKKKPSAAPIHARRARKRSVNPDCCVDRRSGHKMESLRDQKVDRGESTYDSPTESPTDRPTELKIRYYAYRVTLPQSEREALKVILYKYSKDFCFGNHGGHGEGETRDSDDEPLHHFHCVICDFDAKAVDAFKKTMSKTFGKRGNAFHAGKFMDNTIYKGLQYIKHDPNVEWTHRGGHWPDSIDAAPEWEERPDKKAKLEVKEKPGWPVLTYSNVLKQAWKHRDEHKMATHELGQVLEHMTKHTNWTPDIRIMRTGLDKLHFDLFKYKCGGKSGPAPNWWDPKPESHF